MVTATDVYTGLREVTGNTNRDVPFYPGYLWPDAIFDLQTSNLGEFDSYEAMGRFVKGLKPGLVLEWGCGPAHLLRHIEPLDYIGVEGNPDFIRFNQLLKGKERHFLSLDLSKPIRIENEAGLIQADVSVCFEVFEHFLVPDVRVLLDSITLHMRPGSLLLATASNKHRATKDVHLTVMPREWWLETFAKHGLTEEPSLSQELMDAHPWNFRPGSTWAFVLRKT